MGGAGGGAFHFFHCAVTLVLGRKEVGAFDGLKLCLQ